MPRNNYVYIQKNFEEALTGWKPEEKINFLENTLFKRKTLQVNANAKKRKGISK